MRSPLSRWVMAVFGMLLVGGAARAGNTGEQRAEAAGRGLVGAAAPRMVVKTIDNESIDLGALYGKRAVYLKFWATWCTPCREQMPHFQHVYETAGPDLAVVAVNVGFNDSIEAIQSYRKRLGITMPIVFDGDGKLGAAFNLRVTPQHIVIGRNGRIQYVGHLADARLDSALLAARTSDSVAAPASLSGAPEPTEEPRWVLGDLLPNTTVKTLAAQPFRLRPSDLKEPTVLLFLSPWCESYLATTRPAVSAQCRGAREQVEALKAEHRVRWLGIASGLWASPEDLREYRAKYKVTIPLTLDRSGRLFRGFRVANTPTIIIADGHGKMMRRIEPAATDTLEQVLRDF